MNMASVTGVDYSGQDLSDSDLSLTLFENCNFSGTQMEGARIDGCKFVNCVVDGVRVKCIIIDRWPVIWFDDTLSIGCEQHAIEDWVSFTPERIAEMNPEAFVWFEKWFALVMDIIQMSRVSNVVGLALAPAPKRERVIENVPRVRRSRRITPVD